MDNTGNSDARALLRQPGVLSAIRRHLRTVVLSILCGVVLAGAATFVIGKSYVATAYMFLGSPNATTVFRTLPVGQPAAEALSAAQFMRSDQVLERAAKIFGPKRAGSDLLSSVSITPSPTSAEVTIQATATTAAQARDLVNAVGRAYLGTAQSQRAALANRTSAVLKKYVAILTSQAVPLRNMVARLTIQAQNEGASIVDPTRRTQFVQARLNTDPAYLAVQAQLTNLLATLGNVQQKEQQTAIDGSLAGDGADTFLPARLPAATAVLIRNLVIGAALGLLLGSAIAWRRAERRRLPDANVVSTALEAPILGIVPSTKALSAELPTVVDFAPGAQPGGAFKVIAATLLMHAGRRGLDHLVLMSVKPREGRSTLALNIAAAATTIGRSMVLIDADTRRRGLSASVGAGGHDGLTDVIGPGASLSSVLVSIATRDAHLVNLIPVGVSESSIGSLPPDLLLTLRESAIGSDSVALIDPPPSGDDPTALQIAPRGTGVVVVVSPVSSPTELGVLRTQVGLAGMPIIGFLLNDVPFSAQRAEPGAGRKFPARQRPRSRSRPPSVPRLLGPSQSGPIGDMKAPPEGHFPDGSARRHASQF